jgi:hypothetical protein
MRLAAPIHRRRGARRDANRGYAPGRGTINEEIARGREARPVITNAALQAVDMMIVLLDRRRLAVAAGKTQFKGRTRVGGRYGHSGAVERRRQRPDRQRQRHERYAKPVKTHRANLATGAIHGQSLAAVNYHAVSTERQVRKNTGSLLCERNISIAPQQLIAAPVRLLTPHSRNRARTIPQGRFSETPARRNHISAPENTCAADKGSD